jgi:hypothetical protein
MIFASSPVMRFSSARVAGRLTLSPAGSPAVKQTARPAASATMVSTRPASACRRLVFQPLPTGSFPV